MSIKNLRPNPNSRYKQGYFDSYNPKKYFGPRPIIYRSSFELRFMIKMELNENVLQWSSEQIVIPYMMKEKINGKFVDVRHNYHSDFTVILKNGEKYIIEVKPSQFTPLRESQIKRSPVMYKNACKWKAALEWSKLNNYQFKVVTEENLKTRIF